MLVLFGGESRCTSSPLSCCRSAGFSADSWDLADSLGPHDPIELHDLSSDSVWNWFTHDIKRSLHQFVIMMPPSSTFPGASSEGRRGPLRSLEFPMGIPAALRDPKAKELVRLESYFASQCGNLARLAAQHGIPFALVLRRPPPGVLAMADQPELASLVFVQGVLRHDLDQCALGSEVLDPVTLISSGVSPEGLSAKCQHSPRFLSYTDRHGNRVGLTASHLPLSEAEAGRSRAHPALVAALLANLRPGGRGPPPP